MQMRWIEILYEDEGTQSWKREELHAAHVEKNIK